MKMLKPRSKYEFYLEILKEKTSCMFPFRYISWALGRNTYQV